MSINQSTPQNGTIQELDDSSSLEILVIILNAGLHVFLYIFIISSCKSKVGPWIRYFLEYLVVVVPVTLLVTVFHPYIFHVCAFGVLVYNVVLLRLITSSTSIKLTEKGKFGDKSLSSVVKAIVTILHNAEVQGSRLPAVTYFRFATTSLSCLCILAVDFNIFPHKFAKSATYGTGLMDTGVGFFVLSNGFVSPEARGKYKNASSISSKVKCIANTVFSSWLFLVIGFGRLVLLKLLSYPESVTEYGVHWNFFFTLAFIKVFGTIIYLFINVKHSTVVSLLCILSYQLLLSNKTIDLTSVLLSENRNGLLLANKEGIASCAGYFSLYLLAVQTGKLLFQKRPYLIDWAKLTVKFLFLSIFFWVLLHLSATYVQPISRRLCNVSFVIWMTAMSFSGLVLCFTFCITIEVLVCMGKMQRYAVQENWVKPFKAENKIDTGPLLNLANAVNRNQMIYFLLSNLTTGVINLSIDTGNVGTIPAVFILCLYSFIILGFIWWLHIKNITLKYW